MQVTVTGKQIDIGDSLRTHVTERTAAIVARYFGKATEAHVVFCRERHLIKAEILVHAGRSLSVQGANAAEDAYVAFDGAAERIDKRLRRNKRRLRNHHARAGRAESRPREESATSYVLAADEANGADEPLVIAETRTSIPEFSVSEAVMRLDLQELPALLFRNGARGTLNVVYRRPDGNVGWIDPDLAEPRGAHGTKN